MTLHTKNFGVHHIIDFNKHSELLPPLDFRRVKHFINRVVEYSQVISTCGSENHSIHTFGLKSKDKEYVIILEGVCCIT
jgi:hypothetical protein